MNWAEIIIVVLNMHSQLMVSFQLNFILSIELVFSYSNLKKYKNEMLNVKGYACF